MITEIIRSYKAGVNKEEESLKSPKLLVKGSNHKISILKTISWRVIGTIDTMIISYILTGSFTVALGIGSIEVVSKMILYYFHERAWNKITKD
ncbi:DUF2061 domain-containing protein [Zhouia spongiae]|uniref:DUF2061 domain-containing protein n=1 Tax=Zhouia spongiae TaxID=2202721 RepID=A0ABY3YHQ5_9FLAO|nr:DUF2061 domain-containing protein [Zhouia spongiae]UNY97210.1 DUF2061 domain-containing protein [Zhouia spongiae]